MPAPRLPAPGSGALLPASASTVGGNECLAVLVPARLSITLFTRLQGNLLPLVRSGKLTLCARGRRRARPPLALGDSFVYQKVAGGVEEGRREGGSCLEVIHKPLRNLVGRPVWPLNEVQRSRRSWETRGPESLTSKQLGNSKTCQVSRMRTPGK